MKESGINNKKPKHKPACGNYGCGVSMGVCERLTFGFGELSFNGYWEHPCPACAREHEQRCPEDGECWPPNAEQKPSN